MIVLIFRTMILKSINCLYSTMNNVLYYNGTLQISENSTSYGIISTFFYIIWFGGGYIKFLSERVSNNDFIGLQVPEVLSHEYIRITLTIVTN